MRFILHISFLLLSITSNAQKSFPKDFYGFYKGDLHIVNPNGGQTIPMEFHMQATDSAHKHHYTIVYVMNDTTRQEREYTLISNEDNPSQFTIDENNGIILTAMYSDNTLYSLFEVQGGLLTTTERFYEDHMLFEITYSTKSKALVSGGTSDEIPEVLAYPISTIQKAKLIKQD